MKYGFRGSNLSTDAEKNSLIEEEDVGSDIYCANCRYCILFRKSSSSEDDNYVLRVKCAQEQWRKKLGDEKMYKYFTVARRTVGKCSLYQDMGDLKSFLRSLRKNLPVRDEIYAVKK